MFGLYCLLALTVICAGSLMYYGWRNGITPMPSSPAAARTMIAAAEEEARRIKSSGTGNVVTEVAGDYLLSFRRQPGSGSLKVIDAGSGWGGLGLALAERMPYARIIGVENSPLPFLCSFLRALLSSCSNVEFHYADFRRRDIAAADILLCYLYPAGMAQIAAALQRLPADEAPTVISNTFALPGRAADRSIPAGDSLFSPIYVYRPGRRAGGSLLSSGAQSR